MFKVTRKMKRSFNLSSEPDIFLYRLIQQVHKCHPGGPPPLAMLLPPQPPEEKTPKKSTTKTKTKNALLILIWVHTIVMCKYFAPGKSMMAARVRIIWSMGKSTDRTHLFCKYWINTKFEPTFVQNAEFNKQPF